MKQVKESIMTDEIFNQDTEKTAKSFKSSDEAVDVVNGMEKSKKCSILWLAYQQSQIFEGFKMNDNFINMDNKFGISKSTMVFKISIVKFLNKYPSMKTSSLSPYF